MALVHRGPFAVAHYLGGLGLGVALPAALLLLPAPDWMPAVIGVATLVGLWIEEDILVRAGQALSIS